MPPKDVCGVTFKKAYSKKHKILYFMTTCGSRIDGVGIVIHSLKRVGRSGMDAGMLRLVCLYLCLNRFVYLHNSTQVT